MFFNNLFYCDKDRACKQPAIQEEELIKQMVALMDEINIDKLKTIEKIKKEIQRFQKFNYIIMGSNNNDLPKKSIIFLALFLYFKYFRIVSLNSFSIVAFEKSKSIFSDK